MAAIDYALLLLMPVSAFIIALWGIPMLISIARSKRLMDAPDEHRKIHTEQVPSFGGVVFITALWITFSVHPISVEFPGYNYLLAGTILLFIMGIKDDLFMLDPLKKLVAQVAAALLVIVGSGIYIESFGGVLGIYELPLWASVVVTVFMITVVINAFNLIDGIDSLAGSVATLSVLFFSYWFWLTGNEPALIFSLAFIGSMAGFLFYNREPARVFMGDTGSLITGFYLAVLGILFLNSALGQPEIVYWQKSAPILLVAVLIIPLYDTLRIFLIRAAQGKSPFSADANHIHHQLIGLGLSHTVSTLILLGFQSVIVLLTIVASAYLSVNGLLVLVACSSLLLFPTLSIKTKIVRSIPITNIRLRKVDITNKKITDHLNVNGRKEEHHHAYDDLYSAGEEREERVRLEEVVT